MIRLCKSCNNEIPNARIKLLPNVQYCVNCSNEDKVSAVPVIHHKTGNEIQIVRDPEVAAEFHRLASRVGFGTLRGLKAGKSGGTTAKIVATKSKSNVKTFVAKADPATYNKLGEKVMNTLDLLGKDKAMRIIDDAVQSRLISDFQGGSLRKLVNAITQQSANDLEKKIIYSTKLNVTKPVVSEEISEVFRNWKRF